MTSQITLVVLPRSRSLLFPSPPPQTGVAPSALDPTNKAGDESLLSGVEHPIVHRSKAEQVEQQGKEMMHLVERFGTKVLIGGRERKGGNSTVGKKEGEKESSSDDEVDEKDGVKAGELDPTSEIGEDGKKLSAKEIKKKAAKEAKAKRDALVGKIAKGLQDGLGDAADTFERFHQ